MADVVMPQMGESITEGTLTKWLKQPGEKVERDEPLFEISTDKVDTEIPSPVAGTLSEVLVQAGATVAINTIVARVAEGNGASSAPAPAAAAPAPEKAAAEAPSAPVEKAPDAAAAGPYAAPVPEAAPPAAATSNEPQGPLSPLVRKMAREYNIDLGQVKGTGAGGRIQKQDVEAYMSAQGAKTMAQPEPQATTAGPYADTPGPAPTPVAAPVAAPAPAPAAPAPQAAAPAAPVAPLAPAGMAKTRVEPMSIMRQKIAEHMVFSKKTSPHVTTVHRIDMTKIVKQREKAKGEFQAKYGFGLTFLPFIARATVTALQAMPILNASVEGNNIIYHNEINLGIAVSLEGGLIVPVIKNADEKNIVGLQRSIVDLANRARSRQLKPDEIQGGTFTISNYGGGGSLFATPVINQPQVGILGVGAIEKIPVVIDDAIGIRSVCYLSLSFDHRLIDGASGDAFVTKIKQTLEGFSEQVL